MTDDMNTMVPAQPAEALALGQHAGDRGLAAARASAIAAIQARYVMAAQRPRNIDQVRSSVLKECRRPAFARVAWYARPVGSERQDDGSWKQKFAEGPSIRFVEAALRVMGNVDVEQAVVSDTDDALVISVRVTDLETGSGYSREIRIGKTVERRKLGKGERPIRTRTNSYGDTVFIVHATDDQVDVKAAAAISKTVRTLGLRLIPGDIVAEAEEIVRKTAADEGARDPDADRKRLVDAFSGIGVSASMLVEYLGHPLDACSPSEREHLRMVYAAMKDGEVRWSEVVGATVVDTKGEPSEEPAPRGASAKLDAAVARQREKRAAPPAREPGEEG